MEVRDPIVAYIAADNLEAHFVCGRLTVDGVAAAVVDDLSIVGYWIGGIASQLHKPQVYVGRADAATAAAVLYDYERRASARRAANALSTSENLAEAIEVTCEDCGACSAFPAAQRGSVQDCPNCFSYVDVGDVGETDIVIDETAGPDQEGSDDHADDVAGGEDLPEQA